MFLNSKKFFYIAKYTISTLQNHNGKYLTVLNSCVPFRAQIRSSCTFSICYPIQRLYEFSFVVKTYRYMFQSTDKRNYIKGYDMTPETPFGDKTMNNDVL